jgi:hypothetical protein
MAGTSRRPRNSPSTCPDDLAEQSLVFARTQLTDQARPGRFAPAQVVAGHAPAIERLAAFLGRPVNTRHRAVNDPANQDPVPARLHIAQIRALRPPSCWRTSRT